MPRAKNTRGKLKTISCPGCGKKFCTETRVLQHMNQPTSSCFGRSIFETFNSARDGTADSNSEQPRHPEEDQVLNRDHPPPGGNDDDFEMDYVPPNAGDDQPFLGPPPEQLRPGRFVEMFEGCAESFPGGKTFMDVFREDQYAEQRRENRYFPFASKQEWDFASWTLRSRLSMAAIDSLLSLDIVRLSLMF